MSKTRKPIADLIEELRSWLPNYDHGPDSFPNTFYRIIASLPGGDELEDMGYEALPGVGWHEADLLGRVLVEIQGKHDVEDLVAGLVNEEEEEVEEVRRRRPRAREAPASGHLMPQGLVEIVYQLGGIADPVDLKAMGWHLSSIEAAVRQGALVWTRDGRVRLVEHAQHVKWNQNKDGNAWVSDGAEGYWAHFPPGTSAKEVLDVFMETADYSNSTITFTVRAEIDGDVAEVRVEPGGVRPTTTRRPLRRR